MPVVMEQEQRSQTAMEIAHKMAAAARTAPKARGFDNLEIAVVGKKTMTALSKKMVEMVIAKRGASFFARDSDCVLNSDALLLIGTKIGSTELEYCGLCGFANCKEREEQGPLHPCAFNTGDLGIAIGSAVSIAADYRIDNRVMFSVGMAARELGIFAKEVVIVYGIPLSISGKNIFVDRKPKK